MILLLMFLAQVTPAVDNTAAGFLIASIITVASGIIINIIVRFKGDKAINGKVDGVKDTVDGVVKTIASQDETIGNLNAQITELKKDIETLKDERDAAIEGRGEVKRNLEAQQIEFKKSSDLHAAQFIDTTKELQRQITRLEELHVVTTAQLKEVTDDKNKQMEKALGVAEKLAASTETRIGLEHRVIALENTVANNKTIEEIVSGIKTGIQTIANNPPPIPLTASEIQPPAAGESMGAAA